MNNEINFEKNLDKIRIRIKDLGNLSRQEYLLNDHCLNVKNKIDMHVESLINDLNRYRQNLFDEIDEFENKNMKELSKNNSRIDQNLLNKVQDFEEKCANNNESNLELIKESELILKEIEQEKANLNKIIFKDGRIDFEPINLLQFKQNCIGKIMFQPQSKPKIEHDTTQPYYSENLSNILNKNEMRSDYLIILENRKLIQIERGGPQLWLKLLSEEFDTIKKSIQIKNVGLNPYNVAYFNEKIVVSCQSNLIILNDDLEIICEKNLSNLKNYENIFKLTVNENSIVCWIVGGPDRDKFLILDWNLKIINESLADELSSVFSSKIIQIKADNFDGLYVITESDDDDSLCFLYKFCLLTGKKLIGGKSFAFGNFLPHKKDIIVSYRMNILYFLNTQVNNLSIEKIISIKLPTNEEDYTGRFKLIKLENNFALFYNSNDKFLYYYPYE
jgi:hypothetical protein